MKKVFNWTLGSFFRTLGRILAYLGIALVIFFIIEKTGLNGLSILKLNAATTNQVYYNYNDEFVINNVDTDWFGENGKLEQIKNQLIDNNQSFVLGFGSEGIFAMIYTNSLSKTLNVYSKTNNNYGLVNIAFTNSSSGYYNVKGDYLKKYSSVNNFVSSLLNENHYLIYRSNSNAFQLISSELIDDYRSSSYNIWNQSINKWNIIYYISSDISVISNICNENNSSCNNYVINDLNINDITSFVSYYDIYGFSKPSKDIKKITNIIYNNAFIVDVNHIDESIGTFSFKVSNGIEPIIESIQIYGLINDEGLYHYEELNTDIINLEIWEYFNHRQNDYCSFNNDIFSCSILNNEFQHGDLSAYERIYIKINYQNPVFYINNSFSYSFGNAYTYTILLNDICKDCLFLQLTSQGGNTYTFSNSDSSLHTELFYSDILNNDVVYNLPSFINLSNKSIYAADVTVYSNKYYYNTFHKILFNNYKIANTTGLIMNIYMNDLSNAYNLSGAYQILYYITPNLYWSDSLYATDRSSVSGCYINEETGETDCFTIEGDFHNYLSEVTSVDKYFNIINGIMSEDFYGLSGLIITPLEYIRSLNDKVCSPIILPIPFTNSSISIPCMSAIYDEYIPDLINLWHVVVYGVISYAIGVNLFKTIKDSLEADKNDVEVLDL